MTAFLQQLVNGLSLGSIYALIALGYTMVYGIIKLINFAHGDIYMLGAYCAFIITTNCGLGFIPALKYVRFQQNPMLQSPNNPLLNVMLE